MVSRAKGPPPKITQHRPRKNNMNIQFINMAEPEIETGIFRSGVSTLPLSQEARWSSIKYTNFKLQIFFPRRMLQLSFPKKSYSCCVLFDGQKILETVIFFHTIHVLILVWTNILSLKVHQNIELFYLLCFKYKI